MPLQYPAAEVNGWLLEQRDRLRERHAEFVRLEETSPDPEVRDERLRIEGALSAVQTSFGYFGKMWG